MLQPQLMDMYTFKASQVDCQIKESANDSIITYPLLRNDGGEESMYCVSPIHGRSFVMKQRHETDWVVSKGNGLSYSTQPFVISDINDTYIWGALPLEAAMRDYKIGEEIRNLGIKTNKMECVLDLEKTIGINEQNFRAALLQYSVECPYRICDIAFAPHTIIEVAIKSWDSPHSHNYRYQDAAEILIRNLKILHSNSIMHNSMHTQNYTWALELLDFEASRTNKYPYSNLEYEQHVPQLIKAEIVQTYEIINYIAWCLGEPIDYAIIDSIFTEYGFNIGKECNLS